MAKKTKVNRLKNLLIYTLTAVVLAIFAVIPMLAVGYTWVLYTVKSVKLWQFIAVTAVLAISEGFILVTLIGSGE